MYFRLFDGRELSLDGLRLGHSPLVNVPPLSMSEIEIRISNLIRGTFEQTLPYWIRWPEPDRFPTYFALGNFSSVMPTDGEDAMERRSGLVVGWFLWHIERPIREIVDPALEQLDWNRHARNFSWW